jgi:hypothetical protein
MSPRQLVQAWVEAFNRADVDALAAFYTADAVNHQVAETPVCGRDNIRQMFASEFASAQMHCIVENLFEDGQWAILEWRDPSGLRGCGFFHVVHGLPSNAVIGTSYRSCVCAVFLCRVALRCPAPQLRPRENIP